MINPNEMPNPYDLKECPFCGSGHTRIMHDITGRINGVYCCNCRLLAKWTNLPIVPAGKAPFSTVLDKWKAAWNTRGGINHEE